LVIEGGLTLVDINADLEAIRTLLRNHDQRLEVIEKTHPYLKAIAFLSHRSSWLKENALFRKKGCHIAPSHPRKCDRLQQLQQLP
jgi:hypothetical protein